MEIRSHVPTESYKANWDIIFGAKPITTLTHSTKEWAMGKNIKEIVAILDEARASNTSAEDVAAGEEWKKRLIPNER